PPPGVTVPACLAASGSSVCSDVPAFWKPSAAVPSRQFLQRVQGSRLPRHGPDGGAVRAPVRRRAEQSVQRLRRAEAPQAGGTQARQPHSPGLEGRVTGRAPGS
ncbi:hypothetical protein, partial [Streptomyces sp. NPDC048551]|uniref:hypothetical protein n=1 Tax=Streptomyces sp. NPDC048551 TaxID=3155758 RepID=UPI0034297049